MVFEEEIGVVVRFFEELDVAERRRCGQGSCWSRVAYVENECENNSGDGFGDSLGHVVVI